MRNKIKKIILHLLVWGVILSVNLSLFGGYFGHDLDMYELFFMINAPVWAIYLILFYSNYLVFIPKLLFSNSLTAYIFCGITTLGLSYVGVQEFKYSAVASRMREEMPQVSRIDKKNQATSKKNNLKKDSAINHIYGKSPLLTSITERPDRAPKAAKQELIILEDVYRKVGTKKHMYGDIIYYINEDVGVRSIRRPHNEDIYNFGNPRNIMQIYLLLLIFAISLVVGAIEKSVQRSRDLERIYREKMSSELSYLKQQINPHFLFNALNSIYSLVLPHSEPASDAVIKLSSILRYMLYETDKQQVSLDKEMEVIRDYLALQKFKFNDITKVKFNIEGSLVGYTIEPLLLMTFVENAFKYGADNVTPSFIEIDVAVKDSVFTMSVRNRIVVPESHSENSGIGIKNIKRRLDLIYQEGYMLDIKREGDVFIVKLKLKLL